MESVHDRVIEELCANAKSVFAKVDENLLKEVVSLLLSSQKVFVLGIGHSGMFGKILSMKLNQLGIEAYTVFDEINPAFGKGDLFVTISQSGETKTIVALAEKAKDLGGKVLGVTSNSDSTLAGLCDTLVRMDKRADDVSFSTLSLIGDGKRGNLSGLLFGFSCYVLFYTLVVMIMREKGETVESMDARHANLE